MKIAHSPPPPPLPPRGQARYVMDSWTGARASRDALRAAGRHLTCQALFPEPGISPPTPGPRNKKGRKGPHHGSRSHEKSHEHENGINIPHPLTEISPPSKSSRVLRTTEHRGMVWESSRNVRIRPAGWVRVLGKTLPGGKKAPAPCRYGRCGDRRAEG